MKPKLFVSALIAVLLTFAVYADIPPPKQTPPTDWTFALIGATSALVAGVLFVWLGRRFFKRSQ